MASEVLLPDEEFESELPFPLASIYRRFFDAKSDVDRYREAYNLWEAGLMLLRAVAIAAYAELPDEKKEETTSQELLAAFGGSAATLGPRWQNVRTLVPLLADANVEGFAAVNEVLFAPSRRDMMPVAGLDARLVEALTGRHEARNTVCVRELFDHLVEVRNREWHAAPGRARHFYRALGDALLSGLQRLYAVLNPLAGRRLVFLDEIHVTAAHGALIDRYELRGARPRRVESWEIADPKQAAKFEAKTVGIELARTDHDGPAGPPRYLSLHPLVAFDKREEKASFLFRLSKKLKPTYIFYAGGGTPNTSPLSGTQAGVLARLRREPLDEAVLVAWADRTIMDDTDATSVKSHAEGRLGEFELLSRLGEGAMGVVYRAKQPLLDREVAIKCPKVRGNRRMEERFQREILALGRVRHPCLVGVFASGSVGDQCFYAMELIDGAKLADLCSRLRERGTTDLKRADWHTAFLESWQESRKNETLPDGSPLPAAEMQPDRQEVQRDEADAGTPETFRNYVQHVAGLVRQVAEATGALHAEGIVHRDIKPENIMITADNGRPVLMDLGLAQLADDVEGRLTRTRQFVGTFRYASPQQLEGLTADPRNDVYSLGVTFWELLTLRPLFGMDDDASITKSWKKVQSEEPERPSVYNPRVRADLDAVVLKCLEKDPRQRYRDGGELAADLLRWQRGEPVLARPLTIGYLLSKRVARHRRGLLVTAAVMLLLAFGAGTSWRSISRNRTIVQKTQAVLRAKPAEFESAKAALVPFLKAARPELQAALAGDDASQRTWAQLALLDTDDTGTNLESSLCDQILQAEPEMIQVIGRGLKGRPRCVTGLWTQLNDASAETQRRLRAAMALAELDPPTNEKSRQRWNSVAEFVAHQMTAGMVDDPSSYQIVTELFQNANLVLVPALAGLVDAAGGEQKAAVRNMAATVLAAYAVDAPQALANALVAGGEDEFNKLFKPLEQRPDVAAAVLEQMLVERQPATPPQKGAPQINSEIQEARRVSHARRQATAAVALLRLKRGESVWKLFAAGPDPTVRSYLIRLCARSGVDAKLLVSRLHEEQDLSARRALIQTLGGYAFSSLPKETSDDDKVVVWLSQVYRSDPDAGIHASTEWTLRRWGREEEVERHDTELANLAREIPLAGLSKHVAQWQVNRRRQTFAVMAGADEFTMGSPFSEVGRRNTENDADPLSEKQRKATINYPFALAVKEVSNQDFAEFLQANPEERPPPQSDDYSRDRRGPRPGVSWLLAAKYCRWLSEQDDIPPEQMCFPRVQDINDTMVLPENWLERTGYRLPTEAEWEYACRAETQTARYYGVGLELLPDYGWYSANNDVPIAHVGGSKKPNDFGIFDLYGNGFEWCMDAVPTGPAVESAGGAPRPAHRIARGGGMSSPPDAVRSAYRTEFEPSRGGFTIVFRLARTLHAGGEAK